MFRENLNSNVNIGDHPILETSSINVIVQNNNIENLQQQEDFIFGNVLSGFYRFILDSPEIGFGMSEYRRLFSEVMILNSKRKKPLPQPEIPISPMIDMPRVK